MTTAPLYQSTTHETTLASLDPALRAAIEKHATGHQLTLDGARVWLTHSINPPGSGLLSKLLGRRNNPTDADPEHWTCIVVTRTQIALATHGPARGTSVLSLAAIAASARWGMDLGPLGAMAPGLAADPGFSLEGFASATVSAGRAGTMFVKVSDDAAGRACFDAVVACITEAKKG